MKVPAFYLEKQKSFIPKKIFLSRCQYQNKKALFTDSIFREGFGSHYAAFSIETYVFIITHGRLAHVLVVKSSPIVT